MSYEKIDKKNERRIELEKHYPGDVYDTAELAEKFNVLGFSAPMVVVVRKSDGKKGALLFDHMPRFYYQFIGE